MRLTDYERLIKCLQSEWVLSDLMIMAGCRATELAKFQITSFVLFLILLSIANISYKISTQPGVVDFLILNDLEVCNIIKTLCPQNDNIPPEVSLESIFKI